VRFTADSGVYKRRQYNEDRGGEGQLPWTFA